MSWEIELTDEVVTFFEGLTETQQDDLEQRIDYLAEHGPMARRPVVGEIKGSANDPRMKELICESEGEHIRVLFIFDPRQTGILLVGGVKTGNFKGWYRDAIPEADKLYEIYLNELNEEGLI